MSEKSWNRWGADLKQMQDPIPFAKDAMLFSAGLIPTAVLSLVAWVPNFAQLPAKAQADNWWVTPVLLAIVLAAGVITVVMWVTKGALHDRMRRDADRLHDDMNRYHPFGEE